MALLPLDEIKKQLKDKNLSPGMPAYDATINKWHEMAGQPSQGPSAATAPPGTAAGSTSNQGTDSDWEIVKPAVEGFKHSGIGRLAQSAGLIGKDDPNYAPSSMFEEGVYGFGGSVAPLAAGALTGGTGFVAASALDPFIRAKMEGQSTGEALTEGAIGGAEGAIGMAAGKFLPGKLSGAYRWLAKRGAVPAAPLGRIAALAGGEAGAAGRRASMEAVQKHVGRVGAENLGFAGTGATATELREHGVPEDDAQMGAAARRIVGRTGESLAAAAGPTAALEAAMALTRMRGRRRMGDSQPVNETGTETPGAGEGAPKPEAETRPMGGPDKVTLVRLSDGVRQPGVDRAVAERMVAAQPGKFAIETSDTQPQNVPADAPMGAGAGAPKPAPAGDQAAASSAQPTGPEAQAAAAAKIPAELGGMKGDLFELAQHAEATGHGQVIRKMAGDGMSVEDIAKETGLPPLTVRTILTRPIRPEPPRMVTQPGEVIQGGAQPSPPLAGATQEPGAAPGGAAAGAPFPAAGTSEPGGAGPAGGDTAGAGGPGLAGPGRIQRALDALRRVRGIFQRPAPEPAPEAAAAPAPAPASVAPEDTSVPPPVTRQALEPEVLAPNAPMSEGEQLAAYKRAQAENPTQPAPEGQTDEDAQRALQELYDRQRQMAGEGDLSRTETDAELAPEERAGSSEAALATQLQGYEDRLQAAYNRALQAADTDPYAANVLEDAVDHIRSMSDAIQQGKLKDRAWPIEDQLRSIDESVKLVEDLGTQSELARSVLTEQQAAALVSGPGEPVPPEIAGLAERYPDRIGIYEGKGGAVVYNRGYFPDEVGLNMLDEAGMLNRVSELVTPEDWLGEGAETGEHLPDDLSDWQTRGAVEEDELTGLDTEARASRAQRKQNIADAFADSEGKPPAWLNKVPTPGSPHFVQAIRYLQSKITAPVGSSERTAQIDEFRNMLRTMEDRAIVNPEMAARLHAELDAMDAGSARGAVQGERIVPQLGAEGKTAKQIAEEARKQGEAAPSDTTTTTAPGRSLPGGTSEGATQTVKPKRKRKAKEIAARATAESPTEAILAEIKARHAAGETADDLIEILNQRVKDAGTTDTETKVESGTDKEKAGPGSDQDTTTTEGEGGTRPLAARVNWDVPENATPQERLDIYKRVRDEIVALKKEGNVDQNEVAKALQYLSGLAQDARDQLEGTTRTKEAPDRRNILPRNKRTPQEIAEEGRRKKEVVSKSDSERLRGIIEQAAPRREGQSVNDRYKQLTNLWKQLGEMRENGKIPEDTANQLQSEIRAMQSELRRGSIEQTAPGQKAGEKVTSAEREVPKEGAADEEPWKGPGGVNAAFKQLQGKWIRYKAGGGTRFGQVNGWNRKGLKVSVEGVHDVDFVNPRDVMATVNRDKVKPGGSVSYVWDEAAGKLVPEGTEGQLAAKQEAPKGTKEVLGQGKRTLRKKEGESLQDQISRLQGERAAQGEGGEQSGDTTEALLARVKEKLAAGQTADEELAELNRRAKGNPKKG